MSVVAPEFNVLFEYTELALLFRMTCIYVILNILPVHSVYFNGESIHFV